MTMENLRNELPEYAKDIKLNLSSVLTENGAPGLNQKQIFSIALASAYATRNKEIIQAAEAHVKDHLDEKEINAAKASATIMAMNNVYYRFTHSMSDAAYNTMPANLRMNVMMNPGSDKTTFELNSLAVSAINGCAKCVNSHAQQLEKQGLSKQGIQSAVRIASVLNAFAVGREIM